MTPPPSGKKPAAGLSGGRYNRITLLFAAIFKGKTP
jgi:hypothetical protein